MPRAHRDRAARRGLQYRPGIPEPVEPCRREAEGREVLLQVYADAAEKYALGADVRLVGEGRGIERQQRDVVPLRDQLRCQRVVAQTTAAIHVRGPGGDREELHQTAASARWKARRAYRW